MSIEVVELSSLQDQLLKAGLVSKSQVQKAKTDKKKSKKAQRKSKEVVVDESKLNAQKAKEEKIEKDRQLNAKKQAEAEQKAIQAQVKQLIQTNIISKDDGEVAYHFKDGNIIKKIYITEALQEQLMKGRLSIGIIDDRYELIPTGVADKIAQRDEDAVIRVIAENEDGNQDDDDPYADYKIPDDLMW